MYSCRGPCKRTNLVKADLRKDSAIYRGVCKKCWSEEQASKQFLKRVEANPEKYKECLDCDKIFHKCVSPNAVKLRTCCPECGSNKIGALQ